MVRGGADGTFEELFTYACPKFITAAPPALDAPTANTNQVLLWLPDRPPVHRAATVAAACSRHASPPHVTAAAL